MAAGGALVATGGLPPTRELSRLSGATTSHAKTGIKNGGNLRIALTGGSSADTLDAALEVTAVDDERVFALYNGVCRLTNDAKGVVNDLAAEMETNSTATEWTIRLLPDLTFHNGKAVTAEDVKFTFQRILNPKLPGDGFSVLQAIERMEILDPLTVRLFMSTPYAAFPQSLCESENFGIVPVGYDPKHPVGTGPFKYESFTPGVQSVFTRNENYHVSGSPHVDKLTLIDFADNTSAMDALTSGVVDCFGGAPPELLHETPAPFVAQPSLPGMWTPFTMRVDAAPFNDVRVRQAFRLIVDRQAMIEASLDGLGVVGNDVFAENDPCYNKSLHREQDLEQAKFLLKQAGRENLTVELVTSPGIAAGCVEAAEVFAQQAQGAGVRVKINNVPYSTFVGPGYLHWVFAQDFWGTNFFLSQVASGMFKDSPWNETHWNDPHYNALYNEAQATVDPVKRCSVINEMELIDFDSGGYIVYVYNKILNISAAHVRGLEPTGVGNPYSPTNFESVWLD